MTGAIARAIFGKPHVTSRRQNPFTLVQKEEAMLEKDSFLGAIERRHITVAGESPAKRLHVRSIDGAEYSVIENDVSRTIEKIHGLLYGKVIEISGQIDKESKAIAISKLKVVPVRQMRDMKEPDYSLTEDPDMVPRMP